MKSRPATIGVLLLAVMVIYLVNGGPVPLGATQPQQPATPRAPVTTRTVTGYPQPTTTPVPTTPEESTPDPTSPASTPDPTSPTTAAAEQARVQQARTTLASLPVKGRAPMTGYSRAAFGPAWTDVNRNGCDQRNDRVKLDVTHPTFKPGTRDCVVLTGTLVDPYSGQSSTYQRGVAGHEMDHVVALANMWVTGAATQTLEQRTLMANDVDSLQLTTRAMNQQKKASDAASWLPPNKSYRCTYVARQIEIKARYRLWVTPSEKAAMEQILGSC